LRGDETGLIGVDDDLDPVTQAELGHDVADVGLYRGLGDGQQRGDLRVGQTEARYRIGRAAPSIA
jgi:hypothetical protein